MTEVYPYHFTREVITSGEFMNLYDIDNPERVDAEGNQIHLTNEIKDAGLPIAGNCSAETDCKLCFMRELTTEEQAQLAIIVSNHKNNV